MIPTSKWAIRQLADYDARAPGSLFVEGVVLSVAEAYEVQAAVAELRCRRGERIIGYKVGCTSPRIQSQLGIKHCVSGRLFDSERHPSGTTLSRKRFANLAVEGELAVELSREPGEEDFAEASISACVAQVFPVIELHHHVMRGARPTAGELIAHNAIHAGFVAAGGVSPAEVRGELSLALFADDRLLDVCKGAPLIHTIRSSLKWLAATLQERSGRLEAGQTVLTGSVLGLFPVVEDCRIRVVVPPIGEVEAQFVT